MLVKIEIYVKCTLRSIDFCEKNFVMQKISTSYE